MDEPIVQHETVDGLLLVAVDPARARKGELIECGANELRVMKVTKTPCTTDQQGRTTTLMCWAEATNRWCAGGCAVPRVRWSPGTMLGTCCVCGARWEIDGNGVAKRLAVAIPDDKDDTAA